MVKPKLKRHKKPEVEQDELVEAIKHFYPVVAPLEPIEGVTFALELLVNASHIFIRPTQEPISSEEVNEYEIIDATCGRIYYAWESDVHGEGNNRTYVLKIVDYDSRPVIQVKRIVGCLSCCLRTFNCFGTTGSLVEVTTPDGERVGELIQKYNGWRPKFIVANAFEKPTMVILGPSGGDCCYNCNMMADATFDVLDNKGNRIGSIHKGCDPSLEVHPDAFGIKFFTQLTAEEKAILLGGVFSLNIMYFEKTRTSNPYTDSQGHILEQMEQARKDSYKRDMDDLGITDSKSTVTETNSKHQLHMGDPTNLTESEVKGASLISDKKNPLINRRRFTVTE